MGCFFGEELRVTKLSLLLSILIVQMEETKIVTVLSSCEVHTGKNKKHGERDRKKNLLIFLSSSF